MTEIAWDQGRGRISPIGAMLTDLEFSLPDGRSVRPLHKAPWLGEALPLANETPPLLANLQGEWPCVPFGMAPGPHLSGDWASYSPPPDRWPHGFGSNHAWECANVSASCVSARINYPEGDAVRCLSRRVTGVTGRSAVDIELRIEMRREANLPIGLHPVFRLPEKPGRARLCLGSYDGVFTYPGDTGGNPAHSQPTAFRFEDADFDFLSLPYEEPSETLLLISGIDGCAALENQDEGYRASLKWDSADFPSLMLWISNRGRQSTPWNGRHLAIGIEPICSAFDFGQSISTADNPLKKAGLRTAALLTKREPFHTRYEISVEPL